MSKKHKDTEEPIEPVEEFDLSEDEVIPFEIEEEEAVSDVSPEPATPVEQKPSAPDESFVILGFEQLTNWMKSSAARQVKKFAAVKFDPTGFEYKRYDFVAELAFRSVKSGGHIYVPETLGHLPIFENLESLGVFDGMVCLVVP